MNEVDMGGLAGGMLGLIEIIGGAILFPLIGSKAREESRGGRWTRIHFGGAFLGGTT